LRLVWGSSVHTLTLAGQADYLFKDFHHNSPYLFGRAFLSNTGGGGEGTPAETRLATGGGVGYRFPFGRAVLRLEGRFDHIFPKDSEPAQNLFGGYFAIGIVL
jgi:hypothetical protein